jgi:hypothetical protein
MAQDVHPEIRTERGAIVPMDQKQQASFGVLVAKVLDLVEPQLFPLLSGIDPYGHTVFNRLQIPRLAQEARQLVGTVPDQLHAGLGELAAFVDDLAGETHIYLWFIGD